MGKVFGKACRILGSEERKDRSVDWNNILVEIYWFIAFFSVFLDRFMFILVWFERSLQSAQVSEQSCPGPFKLMTSKEAEGT